MHTYIHVTVIKKYEVVNLGESLRDTEKFEERGRKDRSTIDTAIIFEVLKF